MQTRVMMKLTVQAEASCGSEQDLLISEYTPRRVFPFSEEGPGGVIFCPVGKLVRLNLFDKWGPLLIGGLNFCDGTKKDQTAVTIKLCQTKPKPW